MNAKDLFFKVEDGEISDPQKFSKLSPLLSQEQINVRKNIVGIFSYFSKFY